MSECALGPRGEGGYLLGVSWAVWWVRGGVLGAAGGEGVLPRIAGHFTTVPQNRDVVGRHLGQDSEIPNEVKTHYRSDKPQGGHHTEGAPKNRCLNSDLKL